MLDSNLVLESANGTDITLNLTKSGESGTTRADIGQSNGNARTLNIRHSRQGSKADGFSARHLVQVMHTVMSNGVPRVITVNFTMTVPEDPNVAWTNVKDDIAIILDLLTDGALVVPMTSANIDALLRGES